MQKKHVGTALRALAPYGTFRFHKYDRQRYAVTTIVLLTGARQYLFDNTIANNRSGHEERHGALGTIMRSYR